MPEKIMTIVVGVTGASGAIYARAVLRLLEADARVSCVYLVVTETGMRLLASELGIAGEPKMLAAAMTGAPAEKIRLLPNRDVGAVIASGSNPPDAMAVVPCSAGTLSAIATGAADDLLARAADVCLKERKPLVLCLRESPLNRVHLENALRAHDAGAVIMPAMPAFYFGPETLEEAAEQFACRVLAQLGLPQQEQYHWKG